MLNYILSFIADFHACKAVSRYCDIWSDTESRNKLIFAICVKPYIVTVTRYTIL